MRGVSRLPGPCGPPIVGRPLSIVAPVIPTARPLPAISERSPDELAAWLAERGQPAYRARQLRRRLAAGARFEEMLELPAGVRDELAAAYRPSSLREVRRLDA